MIKEVDLVKLGFKEIYEPFELGLSYASAGFIYYTLKVSGVAFYSVPLEQNDCKCKDCSCTKTIVVMDGSEEQIEITDIIKLKDIILSLKRL